jgi:hypothetical protein
MKVNTQTIKIMLVMFSLAILTYAPSPASAAVPFLGWGYSAGNVIYVAGGGNRCDPYVAICGWGWLFDPPYADIISGRLTVEFDPSLTVAEAGWFGDFGANPTLLAPSIGSTVVDETLLQTTCSPEMVSCSIDINQAEGIAVFDFNFGPAGYVPTSGDFNFAGLFFEGLTTPVDAVVVGSPAETAALGTGSPTYMLCSSGYCGETPEPSAIVLALSGSAPGAVLATWRRWRRRRTRT